MQASTALSVAEYNGVERAPFPGWPVGVAAILAAVLALGLPAYSGPDELAHMAYVAALAHGHLPIIPAGDMADIASGTTWQGQHPPLFYLVATPIYLACGKDPTISLYLLRLLSGAGLLVTIVLIQRIAYALLPRDRAGLAAWIAALHPTVVYVSAMVNNESWAMAFSTACVWAAVKANSIADTDSKRERWWLMAAALFGGLGLLTKLTAIAGVAAAIVILAQRTDRKGRLMRALAVGTGAVALWLPWGLTMLKLHGALVPSPIDRPAITGGLMALTFYPREAAAFSFEATAHYAIGLLTPYWLMTPFPFLRTPMLAIGWIVVAATLWLARAQRRFLFAIAAFLALLAIVLNHVLFRDGFAVFFLARYTPIATVLMTLPLAAALGRLPRRARMALAVLFAFIAVAGFAYIAYFYTIGPTGAERWKQSRGYNQTK